MCFACSGAISIAKQCKFFLPICFYFPGHSLADVDLLYCIDQAMQENSELKKNRSEFHAIKESEKQSFASLLPSVGISVSRSQVNQERSDGSGLKLDQEYIMAIYITVLN